jgi:hypothetical protein
VAATSAARRSSGGRAGARRGRSSSEVCLLGTRGTVP